MVATFALIIGVVAVVGFLVGTLRQAVVSGLLAQIFQQKLAEKRQAETLAEAIRVKRMLDAEAFAAHQRMVRAAQQYRDQ